MLAGRCCTGDVGRERWGVVVEMGWHWVCSGGALGVGQTRCYAARTLASPLDAAVATRGVLIGGRSGLLFC